MDASSSTTARRTRGERVLWNLAATILLLWGLILLGSTLALRRHGPEGLICYAVSIAAAAAAAFLFIFANRERRPNDEGAAEVLAVLMLVGVGVLLVAAATALFGGCPACATTIEPSTPGARWANCELVDSNALPTCDAQAQERIVTRDGAPLCHTIVGTIVDEHRELQKPRARVCEVLATAGATAQEATP